MLIAIEGIDGSGKGTQTTALAERLANDGRRVTIIQFPRYSETLFGREVGRYLNGDFGTLEQVQPKFSSLLFALDRFQTVKTIRQALLDGEDVICDRYTGSNVAHQAARVPIEEQSTMIAWIREVEENILGIPKPDLVVFLELDWKHSQGLVARKAKRNYTDKTHDLHEASHEHLQRALQIFKTLSTTLGWTKIDCTDRLGAMRPVAELSEEIYREVIRAR